MERVHCRIFDTYTGETVKEFVVDPRGHEYIDNLPPAKIHVYCSPDGRTGFIDVANGRYARALRADSPDQESKPIEDIEGAIDITGFQVVTVRSDFHNEELTVNMVNENENPGPGTPPRQYQPSLP